MPKKLSLKEIAKEIIRVGEENPDFVYTDQHSEDELAGCGYTGKSIGTNEGQGCIVGQALMNLKVPEDRLTNLDDFFTEVVTRSLLQKYIKKYDKYRDYMLLSVIHNVQVRQDNCYSWGEAITPLKEFMNGTD